MSAASSSAAKSKSAFKPSEEPHCFTDTSGIITTTMIDLPGFRVVRVLGTVYGLSVRSRNIGAAVTSVLKSTVGGELKYLTNLLYTARDHAVERMVGECITRGGNAIIATKFDTSQIMGDFAQVCAYGTACVVEKIETKEDKM
ncbi:UPF0145 domain protein [Lindgomyces ingoldianus]|uniref:UPF0145 domain protein n=1 Tax=Lindgomyces ingoldianus TaxID=673940 RepID=A0ACB6RA30_9PLEO|nr:UPF0145 domain protein [Lindgomyces ingoldianus]KAF2476178.1 UPF0145 domain protein [Lindgomyces ingoldianus]